MEALQKALHCANLKPGICINSLNLCYLWCPHDDFNALNERPEGLCLLQSLHPTRRDSAPELYDWVRKKCGPGKYLLNRAVAKINKILPVLPQHSVFCRQNPLPRKAKLRGKKGRRESLNFSLEDRWKRLRCFSQPAERARGPLPWGRITFQPVHVPPCYAIGDARRPRTRPGSLAPLQTDHEMLSLPHWTLLATGFVLSLIPNPSVR